MKIKGGVMEGASIFQYLPLLLINNHQSPLLVWPYEVREALKGLSKGADSSKVDCGRVLFLAINDIRSSLSLSQYPIPPPPPSLSHGYSLFFDHLLSRDAALKWFRDTLPVMACLLLRLPALLEAHFQNSDGEVKRCLRLLESQESGIVFLSQELIGALLACSFFCLFPVTDRGAKHLPTINFDHLFASLYDTYSEKQENKIKCITHYFERICYAMPGGFVSFERKVLPLDDLPPAISYPRGDFWSKSCIPLSRFKVHTTGLIEDQSSEALEVDFANRYLGGGALNRGCVQEEIRFMISPEMIVGMLFLPSMADNEAIEIIGAERYSNYTGYASTFRFSGDYVDKKDYDMMGRRKTRIIAIDALCSPGRRQFGHECLIREVNKAFCGFLDQSQNRQFQRLYQGDESSSPVSEDICEAPTTFSNGGQHEKQPTESSKGKLSASVGNHDQIGIATGNWGCGAFGGDPELKAILQWIAASQALRPFVAYYSFGLEALQSLDEVTQWILSQGWTVGELWNMLVEYSSRRLKAETEIGFFTWLLPSTSPSDPMMVDKHP